MIQRPHQILREFANQGYSSILYNINSETRGIKKVNENFNIYNKIPPPIIKENKRVIWISYPPLYKSITRFEKDLIVFDCIDYPSDQFNHWNRGIEQLRKRADFIFVTSQELYEFNKEYSNKTYICKNGADVNHFSLEKAVFSNNPEELKSVKKPIIGYFGAIADWIDWKLIKYLAEKNEFSIVLIGPLFKISEIPIKHKNIIYLGQKDYSVLPNYLKQFDVCIIPFLKNTLTSACNPIKMYEYLSAGKPVVTTDLQECKIETVRYSQTHQNFYSNIIDCLNKDNAAEVEKRILFAKKNSWQNRVRYIRAVIEPRLKL